MKTYFACCGWLLACLLMGCVGPSKESPKHKEDRKWVAGALDGEVSLKADRDRLDELRKEIPQAKQDENDELAFYLQQTAELKEHPSRIRERYQNIVQKKRSTFRTKMDNLRNEYRKLETARRDEFLKKQRSEREKFKGKKAKQDVAKDFYRTLDRARLDFHSQVADRRKDFEQELSARQKDFNAAMKERYDAFNEQMRVYDKRFREKEKDKAAAPAEEPKLPEPKLPEPTDSDN